MNAEQIVQDEANEFYNIHMHYSESRKAIDYFHLLKDRLDDFYSPEYKFIFLDQIQLLLSSGLLDHRNKAHKGLPIPNCSQEIKAEKLLFYIKQEIDSLDLRAPQPLNALNKGTEINIGYSGERPLQILK